MAPEQLLGRQEFQEEEEAEEPRQGNYLSLPVCPLLREAEHSFARSKNGQLLPATLSEAHDQISSLSSSLQDCAK